MTPEKALQIVQETIATKNKNNVIVLKDGLQFRFAITILSKHYTTKQLKKLLNKE